MQPTKEEDISEIWQTRFMGFASFSVLLWDHLITFSDEVEYIWKGGKSFLVYLFFINRYLMPLGFIVNLVAYTLQSWDPKTCERYVRYEGSMTVIGIEIVGLMMLLRIHALYKNSWLIVALVAGILVAETGTNVWLLSNATAVQHWHIQDEIRSCSMIFAPGPGAATSGWIPLLYDTIVLLLTLYRVVPAVRRSGTSHILRTVLRDGLLYYSVIFSVTLVLTIMIAAAPQGIQNITAQLELLLTVTMMSRITLHLKKQARAPTLSKHPCDKGAANIVLLRDRSRSDATTRMRSRSLSNAFSPEGVATISRLSPLRIPSTIRSEQNSSIGAESNDHHVMDISQTDERTSNFLELHESYGKITNTSREWDEESLKNYLPT